MLYNTLNTKIRDGEITKTEALKEMKTLMPMLTQYYTSHGGCWVIKHQELLHFPLKGYDIKAIGGKNGSGYIAAGYDFFTGNKHGGHPAHDIFIRDANQDGLDDKTGKEVQVLSACEGVVVATETGWQPGSAQRGGNYIWIYSPTKDVLWYYAHNNKVFVKPGDMVYAGTPIATVGRTGANAAMKRSPTHLHFMTLRFDTGCYPRPENIYQTLKVAAH
jgi:murein DD-endopeptidase MepM/ murein hydrolase activator NlpD